jgi:hypothetical protein
MGTDASTVERGFDTVRAVADAILYEGYLLYPYRRSSAKNKVRWQFGVLVPAGWAQAHGLDDTSVAGSAESWWQQSEFLLRADDNARLSLRLRFLQLQRREAEELTAAGAFRPAGRIVAGGHEELTFDEAVPREFDVEATVGDLLRGGERAGIQVPGGEEITAVSDGCGRPAGRVLRRRSPLRLAMVVTAARCDGEIPAVRVRVRVENAEQTADPATPREVILAQSALATHLLAVAEGGSFISLLDPPPWAAPHARACVNVHTFPVLAGAGACDDVLLSSPVLLYDHPRVSPQSPQDLHDATEIDEILSLRTLTLTDAEKREARATDERAARIVDRVDGMSREVMAGLHGTLRDGDGVRAGTRGPASAALADYGPVAIAGTPVGRGSRVRLHPRRHGTDAQDMFLEGCTGRVAAVLTDLDGERRLAVTLDGDPAAELDEWYGRFRYFSPDEVEPLSAGPLAPRERHRPAAIGGGGPDHFDTGSDGRSQA